MSDHAGILCTAAQVHQARQEAEALTARLARVGVAASRPAEAARAVQWRQMALASQAVLTALDHYIAQGGGSRGARAICDPEGAAVPQSAHGPLEAYRFRQERAEDRESQILICWTKGGMQISTRPNRTLDDTARTFFERDWPAWLTGAIRTTPWPKDQP
jgi:succinate dehydrogenase / fumarate reductase flavoprotein subunit